MLEEWTYVYTCKIYTHISNKKIQNKITRNKIYGIFTMEYVVVILLHVILFLI